MPSDSPVSDSPVSDSPVSDSPVSGSPAANALDLEATLAAAVAFGGDRSRPRPDPKTVVQALIAAESQAKAAKFHHDYGAVVGTWRLTFITGTQKARQRAGVMLGAGKFLPPWVKITLAYGSGALPPLAGLTPPEPDPQGQGQVLNTVEFGGLRLAVGGLTCLHRERILAFDFTRLTASLGALPLYSGYIRQGADREQKFYGQRVKEQAFFSYFWVTEGAIAARGKGGGLALWVRDRP